MSTLVTKNVQVGADGTASNNFTIYQPSTPDGTVRIGNGNSGSVTDAITLNSSGNVGIGTSSPGTKLEINTGSSYSGVSLKGTSSASSGFEMALSGSGVNGYLWNYENGAVLFATNNTERARIDSSGHLIVPNGVTLGTAVGTYNAANTLDDYEEGTWTPVVTDGTVTKSGTGAYVKVGNFVQVWGSLGDIESGGGFTGTVYVTGLPFSTAGTGFQPFASFINYTSTSSTWSAVAYSTAVRFYKIAVTGSDFVQLSGTDTGYYTDIYFAGGYIS